MIGERLIGITDLIAYRECPRRASYGLRRHVAGGVPDGQQQHGQNPHARTPEAGSRAAAYGSAAHDTLAALEDGLDDDAAIQVAWAQWGRWLEPEDLALLRADIATFRSRDFPNTRAVLVEDEIRVPVRLLTGELAYFRARLDRVYERVDRPGSFILVDFKSSRHAKSEAAVRGEPDENGVVDPASLQMRGYDWILHEYLPEIEELVCVYDQLRYGQITVRYSDESRRLMGEFLVAQMTAFFADEDYQEDGLLPPRYNQWCPWCPVLESCPVVAELSDFALTRLAELGEAELQAQGIDHYVEIYDTAKLAAKILDRFIGAVNDVARDLPPAERDRLGFRITDRRNWRFPAPALAQLEARLGTERFLELVSMPKTRLQSLDEDTREWALSLMQPAAPSTVVTRRSSRR